MRALASIVSKLGSVRARASDYAAALALHQEELDLRRKLFERAADDDNDALRDLSLALDRVGNVLARHERLPRRAEIFRGRARRSTGASRRVRPTT